MWKTDAMRAAVAVVSVVVVSVELTLESEG